MTLRVTASKGGRRVLRARVAKMSTLSSETIIVFVLESLSRDQVPFCESYVIFFFLALVKNFSVMTFRISLILGYQSRLPRET